MALLFNGVDQGLTSSLSTLCQNTSQCALMAWINIQSFPALSGGIIQIDTNPPTAASRINLLLLSNGALRIGGRAPDSQSTISSIDSSTLLSLNTWYHVVGMIDFTSRTGYIYINGVLSATIGTLTFTNSITDNTSSYASNLGSNETNSDEFCNIIIEDARVYHSILTASEIQTIYACKGTDSIFSNMQARWLLVGDINSSTRSVQNINTSNIINASSTSNSSSITQAYTIPAGTNLTLIVAVTALSNNSGRVLASNVTFNGAGMTQIASVRTTSSNYKGVSLWYLSVTTGTSGNIVATWNGSSTSKTLFACTLVNSSGYAENSVTAYNNTRATTASLVTYSDCALVISACSSGGGYTMSTIGTNHILDSTIIAGTSAGAIGQISVPIASTVSGIGFISTPTTSGQALILASFPPSAIDAQITELSNNEIVCTCNNGPIYTTSNLKFRRYSYNRT